MSMEDLTVEVTFVWTLVADFALRPVVRGSSPMISTFGAVVVDPMNQSPLRSCVSVILVVGMCSGAGLRNVDDQIVGVLSLMTSDGFAVSRVRQRRGKQVETRASHALSSFSRSSKFEVRKRHGTATGQACGAYICAPAGLMCCFYRQASRHSSQQLGVAVVPSDGADCTPTTSYSVSHLMMVGQIRFCRCT
jgi:hypothetical protein